MIILIAAIMLNRQFVCILCVCTRDAQIYRKNTTHITQNIFKIIVVMITICVNARRKTSIVMLEIDEVIVLLEVIIFISQTFNIEIKIAHFSSADETGIRCQQIEQYTHLVAQYRLFRKSNNLSTLDKLLFRNEARSVALHMLQLVDSERYEEFK